ncbi:MAG: SEC-C metal-binding domain-containing protein, partial [Desulfuromonadales bacterium]|nr:SEC-C metal-binding domain-containing protein [Desulfuromonadales bacterium]
MSQTNRNEPCPCGSGKKYKKCCLGQQEPASQTSSAVSAELQQAMAGHEFTSLEEAQAFADKIIEQRNQTPFDDFHGLSPEQMYHVLNFPFSAPHLVSFPEKLGRLPD